MVSRLAALVLVGLVASSGIATAQDAPSSASAAAPAAATDAPPETPAPASASAPQTMPYDPNGLTADQTASRVVATAPSLEASRIAVRVAELGVRRTRLALFPRFEVSARYTRLSNVSNGGLSGGDDETIEALLRGVDDLEAQLLLRGFTSFEFPIVLNNYVFRASATWAVSDLFFTIMPSLDAARAGVDVRQAQTRVETATIDIRAREAFYQWARAVGARAVAERGVAQAQANRDHIATLVEGGVVARVDLLRMDAVLAQARLGLAQTSAGVAISERALSVLMHAPPTERITLGEAFDDDVPEVTETVEQLIERALDQRPEVAVVAASMDATSHQARAARGGRYPQLLLQANLDVANPNQRIFPTTAEFRPTWDLSAVLRWSPNEYADARARSESARADLVAAEANLNQLRDGVRIEVTQAYEELRGARAAIEAARVGVTAAEESYNVRLRQVDAGAAVANDVIDAESDLTRARLALVDAQIAAKLARDRLSHAVGDDAPAE